MKKCEYRSVCANGGDIEESNDHNRDFHYNNSCIAKNDKGNFLNYTLARLTVEEDEKERFACPAATATSDPFLARLDNSRSTSTFHAILGPPSRIHVSSRSTGQRALFLVNIPKRTCQTLVQRSKATIDHIHRAKAAMTVRANKEFMGLNDLELPDDEQTSEQRQDILQPADKEATRPATYTRQLLQVFNQESKLVPLYSPISSLSSERDSSSFLVTKRDLGPKPPKSRSALKVTPKAATMSHQIATLPMKHHTDVEITVGSFYACGIAEFNEVKPALRCSNFQKFCVDSQAFYKHMYSMKCPWSFTLHHS
ncbi:MAG: hypothetical protein J3R72DRAFT_495891 [Linnemannia gamsii]|nr:MAG: hypothetical protein J3R72DRAFT_495891 [Linnemannia gamsii]